MSRTKATLLSTNNPLNWVITVTHDDQSYDIPIFGASRAAAQDVCTSLNDLELPHKTTKAKVPAWAKNLVETWESVNPIQALEWLKAGAGAEDRSPIMSRVRNYANTMTRNNGEDWVISPDPICFNQSGGRLNGKNRLLAVVQSGTTQIFKVIRNLPDVCQRGMDQQAPRGAADWLHHKFPELPHKSVTAPILNQLITFALGYNNFKDAGGIEAIAEMYYRDLIWLKTQVHLDAKDATPVLKRTIVRATLVIAHHFWPRETGKFVKALINHEGQAVDPTTALRVFLAGLGTAKMKPYDVSAKILAAIHLHKDKGKVTIKKGLPNAVWEAEILCLVGSGGSRRNLVPQGWYNERYMKKGGDPVTRNKSEPPMVANVVSILSGKKSA